MATKFNAIIGTLTNIMGVDCIILPKDFDVYKNTVIQDAYDNDWNAVCLIPSGAFAQIDITKPIPLSVIDMLVYSHNDLIDITYHNLEMCDDVFEAYCKCDDEPRTPEELLEDWANSGHLDLDEYYSYLEPGKSVWWFDKETAGKFFVDQIGYEDPEDETLYSDIIVYISNGVSEAEVPLYELTPISDYREIQKHLND